MSNKKNNASADLARSSRFKTQWDSVPDPGEVNDEASMTVPDQAMSVQEIMLRFTSGRPVNLNSELMYTDDQLLPDLARMDFVERQELIEANAERIKNLQAQVDEKRAVRLEAARAKREKFERILEADEQRVTKQNNPDGQQGTKNE